MSPDREAPTRLRRCSSHSAWCPNGIFLSRSVRVRNSYEQAGQLGADRWAALIGARALHRGPVVVVVMAGTATTVDLLDETGVFLGGLIFPGFDLMRGSLARNTAQLPYADGSYTAQPRRTADAIFSGCLHAQAGAVERLFAQFAIHPAAKCLVGEAGPSCFSAPVGAPEFQPHLVLRAGADRTRVASKPRLSASGQNSTDDDD